MNDAADFIAVQIAKPTSIQRRFQPQPDYEMDAGDEWFNLTGDDANVATALFSTECAEDAWLSDAGHGRFTEHGYTVYVATFIGLRVEALHDTYNYDRAWCEFVMPDGVIAALEARANDLLND